MKNNVTRKKVGMEPPQYNGGLLGIQKREYLAKRKPLRTKKEMPLYDDQIQTSRVGSKRDESDAINFPAVPLQGSLLELF